MKKEKSAPLTLEQLIPIFGRAKEQADEYKKVADSQNKQIKKYMSSMLKENESSVDKEVGEWIATYQVRTTESYNEDALIEFAKKHKVLRSCVETKEVFNFNSLENLIYAGSLTKKAIAELDKFRTFKSTEYLYIKKKGDK